MMGHARPRDQYRSIVAATRHRRRLGRHLRLGMGLHPREMEQPRRVALRDVPVVDRRPDLLRRPRRHGPALVTRGFPRRVRWAVCSSPRISGSGSPDQHTTIADVAVTARSLRSRSPSSRPVVCTSTSRDGTGCWSGYRSSGSRWSSIASLRLTVVESLRRSAGSVWDRHVERLLVLLATRAGTRRPDRLLAGCVMLAGPW